MFLPLTPWTGPPLGLPLVPAPHAPCPAVASPGPFIPLSSYAVGSACHGANLRLLNARRATRTLSGRSLHLAFRGVPHPGAGRTRPGRGFAPLHGKVFLHCQPPHPHFWAQVLHISITGARRLCLGCNSVRVPEREGLICVAVILNIIHGNGSSGEAAACSCCPGLSLQPRAGRGQGAGRGGLFWLFTERKSSSSGCSPLPCDRRNV